MTTRFPNGLTTAAKVAPLGEFILDAQFISGPLVRFRSLKLCRGHFRDAL